MAINRIKLSKGKLRAFLSQRYKGKTAHKILKVFDLINPIDYGNFCQQLDNLLNKSHKSLLKMAFNVYDFNNDKYICSLDLYALMKSIEGEDQLFDNSFSYDFCKISAFLENKRKKRGTTNIDETKKINKIFKRANDEA